MVVEGEDLHAPPELGGVVRALGAQVVHHVAVLVPRLEEGGHLGHRVAVDALDLLRGKAHRDDAWRDVREVEVEAALLEAPCAATEKKGEGTGRRSRATAAGAGGPSAARRRRRHGASGRFERAWVRARVRAGCGGARFFLETIWRSVPPMMSTLGSETPKRPPFLALGVSSALPPSGSSSASSSSSSSSAGSGSTSVGRTDLRDGRSAKLTSTLKSRAKCLSLVSLHAPSSSFFGSISRSSASSRGGCCSPGGGSAASSCESGCAAGGGRAGQRENRARTTTRLLLPPRRVLLGPSWGLRAARGAPAGASRSGACGGSSTAPGRRQRRKSRR